MIDITMSTAVRPEILEKTLRSIKKYVLCSEELRLIINIDSRGEKEYTQYHCSQIAQEYFSSCAIRTPRDGPVSASQRWLWEMADSDYVLNWEDDWEALKAINLNMIISRILANPRASMIYFDREDKQVLTHDGYRDVFMYMGGNLYQRLKGILLWSSPALVRKTYIKQALNYINDLEYMDFTSRTSEVQKFLQQWDFLTYVDFSDPSPFVRDLGRPWMKKKGLRGNKQGPIGYQWEKING